MDLYVPRKCSGTNRIIKAKDHASVQISIGTLFQLSHKTPQGLTEIRQGRRPGQIHRREPDLRVSPLNPASVVLVEGRTDWDSVGFAGS